MRTYLVTTALLIALAAPARAADHYVAATGAADGDGTKEKPFDDPQKAIDKAVSGDVIHVAQGTYSGKLKCGFLVIDKQGLTLAGGYKDATFAERNPMLYPTQVKEHPEARGSTFSGGYVRVGNDTGSINCRGTTIDGFWFDRQGQNAYSKEGNLGVTASNSAPIVTLSDSDSHLLNCVFANSALYGVRVNGDGSSVENCLFLNNNYCALDAYGKGERLGKGYQFNKIKISKNTFFSVWNADSLEEAAGAAITNNGNAELDISDNVFALTNGHNPANPGLMGWSIKDVKNFKGDKWISLTRNSFSHLRGGMMMFYAPQQKGTIGLWKDVAELKEAPLGACEGNDAEAPLYEVDVEWLKRYSTVVAREDVSRSRVKMDDWNKLRRLMKLPLEGDPAKPGGNLGTFYPVDHAKTGAFWKPTNEKVKGRGASADGAFPIVKSKVAETAGAASAAGGGEKKVYQEVDWKTLWAKGNDLVDKAIKVKCYYVQWDTSYAAGFGKKAVAYLEGADAKTHKILALREVPEMENAANAIKGYVKLGSTALDYVNKSAGRAGARGECNFSFVVHGVVKKAGSKLTGTGPQIVIDVDEITAK